MTFELDGSVNNMTVNLFNSFGNIENVTSIHCFCIKNLLNPDAISTVFTKPALIVKVHQ